MKRNLCIVVALVFLLAPDAVRAGVSMAAIEKIDCLDTTQLKLLFDKNTDFVLINTLSPVEFAEERIKGSINVPYTFLKKGITKLPEDTSKRLIFYCKGPM